MLNLLKADFFRVIKDKMFMILSIICGAISVTIPIAIFGLFSLVTEGSAPLRDSYSALSVTDLIASPFSTFGLVLIIFLLVLLGKDNNTLRNKVIVGKSRSEIYFSNAVLTLLLYLGFMLVHLIITFVVSLIFFKSGLDSEHIGDFIVGVLLKILGYATIASSIVFFASAFHNVAPGIIFSILLGNLFYVAGTIATSFINPEMEESTINTIRILTYVDYPYSIGLTLTAVSQGAIYLVPYLTSTIAFSALFIGFGYLIFKNKDLK